MGSVILLSVILLTSLEHPCKRLEIGLSSGLFLHASCRVLSGNGEEGNLKSSQEYSKKMLRPSSQLCSQVWEAHGQRDVHGHPTKPSRQAPPEPLHNGFSCANSLTLNKSNYITY